MLHKYHIHILLTDVMRGIFPIYKDVMYNSASTLLYRTYNIYIYINLVLTNIEY